jgi:RNA polymerase sigma-70 factor (subfamily 1)
MNESGKEAGLIGRFQEGDPDAFRELFEPCEGALRRQLERMLPNKLQRRFSISDAIQEARIVALDKHAEFEPRGEGSFRRWVMGIAVMRARQALRTHNADKRGMNREVTRSQRADTAQYAGRGPSPSEAAIASELTRHARDAMAELSEDYREVLRLTRTEQLSLKEAGETMGRSYEAIKKLYGRALASFAKELKKVRGERGEQHG